MAINVTHRPRFPGPSFTFIAPGLKRKFRVPRRIRQREASRRQRFPAERISITRRPRGQFGVTGVIGNGETGTRDRSHSQATSVALHVNRRHVTPWSIGRGRENRRHGGYLLRSFSR